MNSDLDGIKTTTRDIKSSDPYKIITVSRTNSNKQNSGVMGINSDRKQADFDMKSSSPAKRSLNQVAASNIGNKMLNPSLRIK